MRLYKIALVLLLIVLVGAAGCSKAKIASKATPSPTSDLGAIVEATVKAELTAIAATATVTVAEPVVPTLTISATMPAPTPVPTMAPTVGALVPTPTLAPSPTPTALPPTPTPCIVREYVEQHSGSLRIIRQLCDGRYVDVGPFVPGYTPVFGRWIDPLRVSPGSRSVPAGASTVYDVSTYGSSYSYVPDVSWVIKGDLPPATTVDLFTTASPLGKQLVVRTSCSTPQGVYYIGIQVIGGGAGGVAELRVGSPLTESSPGTFTGSFLRDTVSVRTGGPSTLTNGPFLNLQFCDKPEKRVLKVVVHSVSTAQGAAMPLRSPMLLETLVGPVAVGEEFYLDPVNAMNALYAAGTEPWRLTGPVGSLEWTIREGQYFVYFPSSSVEKQQPAYVTYQVEIVPEVPQ